jgi:uncharacterized protein
VDKTVIDTQPVIAMLNQEKNYNEIRDFFIKSQKEQKAMYMTSINYGELYYIVLRNKGVEKADTLYEFLSSIPVEIISVDHAIAKQAAGYKAFKKMSYADCFAAALAKILGAPILTGDPEFKEVEKEIKVIWI